MVAPGGGCFRSEDRGESRSQVLQGLLSLLRVTIIAVAVGPLAKGLVDAHVSLRVGQTLLISGEEAKRGTQVVGQAAGWGHLLSVRLLPWALWL